MLKQKVEQVLVEQIQKEAFSSNLYLAMASWAERNGFAGTAQWMYVQSNEERLHMLKFIGYVNERGGKAIIPEIEKPSAEFDSIGDLFKKTYDHELYITDSINNIVGVTIDEKDFTTNQWIQWFVTEQIEEEKNVTAILDKLKLTGEKGNLYLFDKDILGMRTAGTSNNAV